MGCTALRQNEEDKKLAVGRKSFDELGDGLELGACNFNGRTASE